LTKGEFITRATVWIALLSYAAGASISLLFPNDFRLLGRARLAWTVGCIALVLHAASALGYYHHWSQQSAYLETARQTKEIFRLDWGGGLWINYGFITAWIIDTIWWWRGLPAFRCRPRILVAIWHSVFLFMVFNATVVFKTGVLRGLGLVGCLALLVLLIRTLVSSGSRAKSPNKVLAEE
jgi:hypothetical protein